MEGYARPDGRRPDQLRPVRFQLDIAPNAAASVLVAFGQTQVICAASLEAEVPRWKQAENDASGWLTAEYSMLPYATQERKPRDISKGRQDGRSVEIQRLIGRSLRAVADLTRLPGHTLWLDCDVLQADGGTRTAAITGAWLAAELAVRRAIRAGRLIEPLFRDSVAAVSVGLLNGAALLDLGYAEDRDAMVDANIVMTGTGQFVEAQASGEEATFSHDQLQQLLALARHGLDHLARLQQEALHQACTP